MTRFSMATLCLALALSTAARGQTYGGSAAQPNVDRQQLREQLRNSGNPSGSTCPIRVLADYGKRVAAENAEKSRPKSAWVGPGTGQ
jgi:hypothetical protein